MSSSRSHLNRFDARTLVARLRREASEETYQSLRDGVRSQVAGVLGASHPHLMAIVNQVMHDTWAVIQASGFTEEAIVAQEIPAAVRHWSARSRWEEAALHRKSEPARMTLAAEKRINRRRRLGNIETLARRPKRSLDEGVIPKLASKVQGGDPALVQE